MNRANFEIKVMERIRSGCPKRNFFEAQVTMENGWRWNAMSGNFSEGKTRDFQFNNLLDILYYTLKKQHASDETAQSEGQSPVA